MRLADKEFSFTWLLLSMLLLLFFSEFFASSVFARLMRAGLILAVLGSAVFAAYSDRKFVTLLCSLGALGLVAQVGLIFVKSESLFVLSQLSLGLFFWCVTVVLLLAVFRAVVVKADTIVGAVCVYLLLGISFSFLFALIEFFVPGSFSIFASEANASSWYEKDFDSFFYFSLVTLTTLGYGDIAPTSTFARDMAVLEAIVGQFYLTVLVARLVALNLIAKPPE